MVGADELEEEEGCDATDAPEVVVVSAAWFRASDEGNGSRRRTLVEIEDEVALLVGIAFATDPDDKLLDCWEPIDPNHWVLDAHMKKRLFHSSRIDLGIAEEKLS